MTSIISLSLANDQKLKFDHSSDLKNNIVLWLFLHACLRVKCECKIDKKSDRAHNVAVSKELSPSLSHKWHGGTTYNQHTLRLITG